MVHLATIDGTFHERWLRIITLADHNTRVVLLGTTILGIACGVIGSFMLLRKRSLMGDAVSHATLPGIAIAFLVMTAFGGDGKFLPGLLLGAFVSGVAGMLFVLWVSHSSRLKQDAALGIVLSVFFGLGVALLGIVQRSAHGHAAGLESFIYGKTASMLASDAMTIGIAAAAVVAVCVAFFKEFGLLCFDSEFAASQGLRVVALDTLMMGLVVAVTVIGLQAVGLILIIAMLVIPAASARFWTDRLTTMVALAAALGAVSGGVGAAVSGLAPRLPAGAVIVLVASAGFAVSLLLGPARGVLPRFWRHRGLERHVARQHLLRAMYEEIEHARAPDGDHPSSRQPVSIDVVEAHRSWTSRQFRRVLRRAIRNGLVYEAPDRRIGFTDEGFGIAERMVRNHRLWELYLITHADVAPSHVDRGADRIEHVLGHGMVAKLEALLATSGGAGSVPPTPHPIETLGPATTESSDETGGASR